VTNRKFRSLKLQNNVSAILMMMVHSVSMSVLYVVVKNLTQYMHPDQIGFLYKFTILIIVTISCLDKDFKNHLKTKKIKLHICRGVFSILGSLSMFRALSHIGAADAAALSKLEHSIMVLIGVFVFKEQLSKSKIILLVGSIIGAAFIFDFRAVQCKLDLGHAYVLLALVFWLINNVVVKKLGRTERSRAQLFYSSLIASAISFFFAFPSWQAINLHHFYLVVVAALASMIHKLTFFKAYKLTDISVASPFDYMRLVITASLAYIFLGEKPSDTSLIGYALITAVGIYFLLSEGRKQGFRKKVNQPSESLQQPCE
jgi:drug/metabolite transporter (DMT)-like permease